MRWVQRRVVCRHVACSTALFENNDVKLDQYVNEKAVLVRALTRLHKPGMELSHHLHTQI